MLAPMSWEVRRLLGWGGERMQGAQLFELCEDQPDHLADCASGPSTMSPPGRRTYPAGGALGPSAGIVEACGVTRSCWSAAMPFIGSVGLLLTRLAVRVG
jgi:hypothetical protein